MPRSLMNENTGMAISVGWKIIKDIECSLVGKAVYDDGADRIMKSTKKFPVEGGWIYNVSTEYHKGNQVSVAEAAVFVPGSTQTGGE